MRADLDRLFEQLWTNYVAITPHARRIRDFLEQRGEPLVNDHVAFRTFDRAPVSLPDLEHHLVGLGYRRHAPYHFPAKRVKAFGYLPPEPDYPRVFLSEVMTQMLSERAQRVIGRLCDEIDPTDVTGPEVFWSGRLWGPIAHAEYLQLAEESEYAAWVAALGIRPNHFTWSVNRLESFAGIEAVVDALEAEGYALNTEGGRIKGGHEVLLAQASTLADHMPVTFRGGEEHVIPTCYVEFAQRYADASGQLYQGFVAASADRIFESTNRER